jgi:hypothetical protein
MYWKPRRYTPYALRGRRREEGQIITVLALCSITCGTVLVVKGSRDPSPTRASRLVAGSTFLAGVMLFGLVIWG